MKRVVVTGMAGITSLGETADDIFARFEAGKSGIRYMPEWEQYVDLRTKLAGPVETFHIPKHFNRKVTRGMGRVALMSVVCAELRYKMLVCLDMKFYLVAKRVLPLGLLRVA